MEPIEEEYSKLAKKHGLPSYEELNDDFEIETIEKEGFLLREIRRRINEKIEAYIKFTEDIVQPDTSLSSMHEARFFSDEERSEVFVIYRRLMFLNRMSVECSIGDNEEKSSDFIRKSFEEWKDMEKDLSKIAKRSKEIWLKDTDIKEELGYMG